MNNLNTNYPKLSDREIEILFLISIEMSNSEIAEKLFLSRYTIDSHKKNLFLKLNASNSAGLITRAFQLKILPMEIPTSLV